MKKSLISLLSTLKPKTLPEWIVAAFVIFCLPPLFGRFTLPDLYVWNMVTNLGHYFLFAALAYLVLERIKDKPLKWQSMAMAALVCVGIAIEISQIFTARDADVVDALVDVVGIAGVWSWYWRSSWYSWIGRIVFNGIIAGHSSFVLLVAIWVFQINHQQPLIADFEGRTELYRWQGNIEQSDVNASNGKKSLKFRLSTRRYSGISLDILPRNWGGYQAIAFDLYNPDNEPISMVLRVNDSNHRKFRYRYDDRFNRSIEVKPGWNYFQFPLQEIKNSPRGREMDLTEIENVMLFAVELPSPRILYTDHWRLL